VGLLLLRIVAGGAAVSQGGSYLMHASEPDTASWALATLAVVSGIGLIAGFLTPAAAALVSISALVMAATWWPPPLGASLLMDRPAAALVAVDALALALLGPGAHSIDSYLFGRREIIIPRDSPQQ
jgi:putative oxidoreductase